MRQQVAEIVIEPSKAGGHILECSQEFERMTGLSSRELAELFGNQWVRLFSAEDLPAADALFTQVEDALCPWLFSLQCAGNGILPVLIQVVGQAQGGAKRVRVQDASFLGEQTVRMSKRIHSLEESVPSGLCQVLMDDEFTVIWHNRAYLEMIGYTQEQFEGSLRSKASSYFSREDCLRVREMLLKAQRTGLRMFTTEVRMLRGDGQLGTYLVSLSFTGEELEGIPVLYSIGIDITEQKRAQQLETDTQRMRAAMEQASSYLIEYDVLQHRLETSPGLARYFGLTGVVAGVPEALLATGRIGQDSAQSLREMLESIARGEERAEGEIQILPMGGEPQSWLHLRMTTIFDDAMRPVRAILLMDDVSEQRRVEMRYREEEKRRSAMTYDMEFSCQINLTMDQILSVNEQRFPFYQQKPVRSGEELMRRKAERYIHPEDRADYLRSLSAAYMLESFEQGVPEICLDFREYQPDGSTQWRRLVSHIIREPVRGDICAYMYTKLIEEEKQRELELRRHAEQDNLTGLLNRYTVEMRCDRMLQERGAGQNYVLYMLDLDNFKHLNDTYGHHRGDDMLRQMARSMHVSFGDQFLLGRLGGDEFIVFGEYTDPVLAEERAERFCKEVCALPAGAGVVTISVGLAFSPRNGDTFAQLYHCGDRALYQAKREGKNRCAVYDESAGLDLLGDNRLAVSREWLLEESTDIIYVVDFYSYDLLYMNREARALFGLREGGCRGHKCYEVLQDLDHPCEFCTNHLLCREKFYTWEYRNPKVGRSLLLRDRIVDWYGVPARIEFATDVSVMDRRNQALEEQVEIDHVILSCLRKLATDRRFETAAADMLEQLAQFYQADRAFLLDYRQEDNQLLPRCEWTRPGLRTVKQLLGERGLPASSQVQDCLRLRNNFIFDFTEETCGLEVEYERILYDAGVSSQRCVAYYVDGKPAGCLGLDNPMRFRGEITVLETLGYFLSEKLMQNKLAQRLSYLNCFDSLTGLYNRNQFADFADELGTRPVRSLGVAAVDVGGLGTMREYSGQEDQEERLLKERPWGTRIFRLSGDEYVVCVPDMDRERFLELIKRLTDTAPTIPGQRIAVGVTWSDEPVNCPNLTMEAVRKMKRHKRDHSNGVEEIG